MSAGYRYRIMGRFLRGPEDKLYGMLRDEADDTEARQTLRLAAADAEAYGRWSDLRLERSVAGEWEPVNP